MQDIFPVLDDNWQVIKRGLVGRFTTQTFQAQVEQKAPDVWAEMVRRWGPGGKGSGRRFSPATVLSNYLKDKVSKQEVVAHDFVHSTDGFGSPWVKQWELSGGIQIPLTEDDISFIEGRPIYRNHLGRERKPAIRSRLLKSREAVGLSCDLCGTTGENFSEDVRSATFEAHHDKMPISDGERQTKLNDMALLCACCHRVLHRLITTRKKWLTVKQARKLTVIVK